MPLGAVLVLFAQDWLYVSNDGNLQPYPSQECVLSIS